MLQEWAVLFFGSGKGRFQGCIRRTRAA